MVSESKGFSFCKVVRNSETKVFIYLWSNYSQKQRTGWREGLIAHKNFRFEKVISKHQFLPIMKWLIATQKKLVSVITLCAQSKHHPNLQQPNFWLFIHSTFTLRCTGIQKIPSCSWYSMKSFNVEGCNRQAVASNCTCFRCYRLTVLRIFE